MKTRSEDFAGLSVALITPFRDGQVDIEALQRLVEFQVKDGTPAFARWEPPASVRRSRIPSTSG